MYLDAHAAEIETVSLAKKSGFTVVYEEENKPRTDGKTIYVQRPRVDWNYEQWIMWRHTVYHEIGHNVPEMRDIFDKIKELNIDTRSFYGSVLNLCDDYRQEHFKHDEFKGRQKIMSKAAAIFFETAPIFGNFGESTDPYWQAIETLISVDTACRESWQPDVIGWGDKFFKKLPKASQEKVELITKSGIYKRLHNCTADQEIVIVDELLKMLGLDPQKELEKSQAASALAKASGKDKDGDEEAKDKAKPKRVKYEWSDYFLDSHAKKEDHKSVSLDYGESVKASRITRTAVKDDFLVIDYNRNINVNNKPVDETHINSIKNIVHKTDLASKLRNLLQIVSKSRNQHGQLQGKVSAKSLYRGCMADTGRYQERIFRQKIETRLLDCAITILIDYSGSMRGTKINNATACGYMLNEAIGALNVPCELVGFSDFINSSYMGKDRKILQAVFKAFDDRTQSENIIKFMSNFTHFMSQNADGDHILWAYSRLTKRKERRKILIVLSDGSPATPRADYSVYTKLVNQQIEKKGIVELYGIGIEDDNVRHYYKHHRVIEDSSQLESAVLSVVKEKILGIN